MKIRCKERENSIADCVKSYYVTINCLGRRELFVDYMLIDGVIITDIKSGFYRRYMFYTYKEMISLFKDFLRECVLWR